MAEVAASMAGPLGMVTLRGEHGDARLRDAATALSGTPFPERGRIEGDSGRAQPVRLRFTVDEFYKMFELGFIKDYEHVEIIDGELIKKMSIGDLHAAVVDFLNEFFVKNTSDDIRVRVQNPVRLSDYHEPEPDLALTDLTKYDGRRHPRPEEVLLVVEVSDTTLDYDRNRKLPLYAEAGIAEFWLINLQNETVEVHTQPRGGIYSLIRVLRRGDTLRSETVPNLNVEVDKIIG